MRYDASGTNNGIVTDGNTAENGAASSNPYTISNSNGFRNQGARYTLG